MRKGTLVALAVTILVGMPSLAGDSGTGWYPRTAPTAGPVLSDLDELRVEVSDEATPSLAGAEAGWYSLSAEHRLAPAFSGKAKDTAGLRFLVGKNKPDTVSWVVTGVSLAGLAYLIADGDEDRIRDAGDVTQFIPMAFALPTTLIAQDWRGLGQAAMSGGVTFATVHTIKQLSEKWRPDATNQESFPSGHTAASFWGAAFVYRRYGPRWGAPMYVFSTYTGLSRVIGQKHFMDDVVSGMAVGILSNQFFVEPVDQRFQVSIASLPEGGHGVTVAFDLNGKRAAPPATHHKEDKRRRWTFGWEFGGANTDFNNVTAPPDGETIGWLWDENANPVTTAGVGIGWNPKGRHVVIAALFPYEARDFGTPEEDIDFNGVTFQAGNELRSIYYLYDISLNYRYRIVESRWFRIGLGGGLQVVGVGASLEETEGDLASEAADTYFLPVAHGHFGIKFLENLELYFEADGMQIGDDQYANYTARIEWAINPLWVVSFGGRRIESRMKGNNMENDIDLGAWTLGVNYNF